LRSGSLCSKAACDAGSWIDLANDRTELKPVFEDVPVTPAAARAQQGFARVVERAEALPAGLFVGAIVIASAALRFPFARNKPAPWIWTDSLVYSELAKSFAASGHFALRDVPGRAGFGIVYPILLAPSYALFSDVPQAFTAMKATNCLVMSLAAIPTYLLARGLVGRWLALTAAMLSVAFCDLAYTGTIMTENAFYPVFAFWCWATVRAFQSPTVRRQLLVLLLLGLAYFTRPQAIVLVPALVTTLVLVVGLDAWPRRGRSISRALVEATRPYLTFLIALTLAAVAFVVVEVGIRGKGWSDLLGPYSFAASVHYSPGAVGRWFLYHVGELDFAFFLLPFAGLLLVVFAGLRPRAARELRVFAAVALSASFWLILGVAAFASTVYAERLLERSAFYVAPLCMVALVACVGRGLLWSERKAAAVAAVTAVGLVGVLQYPTLLGPNEANDTFGLFTLNSVLERGWVGKPQLQAAVMVAATVAGLVFLATPRRFGAMLPLLALLALALANGPVERRIQIASEQSRDGAVRVRRDWIDRAVGAKADVATLWTGRETFVTLWNNEFFNRSVGTVYHFGPPPDGLPETPVTLDPKTGEVLASGSPVHPKYILVDPSVDILGRQIVRDPIIGMAVYRVAPPLRFRTETEGLYPDFWSGPTAVWTGYQCRGGRLVATIFSDLDLHPRPLTIVARSGSNVVRFRYKAGRVARLATPLESKAGVCRVTFSVPTAVPQQVIGNADTRALGVRFFGLAYVPRR
jgi:hypothetical protein